MSRLWSVCDVQGQCGRLKPCQGLCEAQVYLVDYFHFFLLTILCSIFLCVILLPIVGVFKKIQ